MNGPTRGPTPSSLLIQAQPGHAIRRLHQIAVALFLQETAEHGITPVQYAALQTIQDQPGLDQRTLARLIAQDTSTTAGVLERLEARGWIRREPSATDRRARVLSITAEGAALLRAVLPGMLRAQERILAPLPPADRRRFMQMMQRLIAENNQLSRAPGSEPG